MRQSAIVRGKPPMRHSPVIAGLFVGLVAAVALAGSAAPARAATAPQLEKAGWTCIPPLITDELHCFSPRGFDRLIRGEAKVVKALVFDPRGQEFLGTEINVRNDVFLHGQDRPCPTEDSGEYTYLYPIYLQFGLELDYWACHRFDSDHL
jgi:hypothetical protein